MHHTPHIASYALTGTSCRSGLRGIKSALLESWTPSRSKSSNAVTDNMLFKISSALTLLSLIAVAWSHECVRSKPIKGAKWQLHTYTIDNCVTHNGNPKVYYGGAPKTYCSCYELEGAEVEGKNDLASFSFTTEEQPGQRLEFFAGKSCSGKSLGKSPVRRGSWQSDWQENHFHKKALSFQIC
ncbi:hypothetical protein BV22DRAFT_75069 [Leucogyrophana mollusca]|uniref:Uncharacterized protein n=1 Tax=Leucogyrophana mollusca TaxID=85980 RepID=A0ACB8C079_9AGAM|nr:hypothetical protein BV22DRAFT_75069 [Leucogyrophana mollusca]